MDGREQEQIRADVEKAFQRWWERYVECLVGHPISPHQLRVIKNRCRADYVRNFTTIRLGTWRWN